MQLSTRQASYLIKTIFIEMAFPQLSRYLVMSKLWIGVEEKRFLPPSRALQMASSVYCFLLQALSRYNKAAVELTDYPNGQRTLSGKNLLDAIAFADHWLQVFFRF